MQRMQMQAAFISLLEDLAPVVWQTETAIQCGSSNNGGYPKGYPNWIKLVILKYVWLDFDGTLYSE